MTQPPLKKQPASISLIAICTVCAFAPVIARCALAIASAIAAFRLSERLSRGTWTR